MLTRILTFVATASILLLLGCSPAAEKPSVVEPTPNEESPAAGLRLAPGFYDLEDGTAQAMGNLEWRDLEGGFWAIVGGFEGDTDKVIAVIANGDDFQRELEPLKGKLVLVTGKRADGASVRMAGPEIEMESVKEMKDTPGISE